MTDVGDRRRSPRVRFSGIILIRAGDVDLSCVGGDISETGVLLYPTRPPSTPPQQMRITFALPNSSSWFMADGELIREKRVARRTIWAVRFTSMDEQTRLALRAFVKENDLHRAEPRWVPAQELADLRPIPNLDSESRRREARPSNSRPEGQLAEAMPLGECLAEHQTPTMPQAEPGPLIEQVTTASEMEMVVCIEAELPSQIISDQAATRVVSSDEINDLASASVSESEQTDEIPSLPEDQYDENAATENQSNSLPRRPLRGSSQS